MRKRILAGAAACVLALGMASPAVANQGQGNGAAGCTLSNNSTYKNPGAMLKYLTQRDGHFQNTVDIYSHHFASVGDLIGQKCGA